MMASVSPRRRKRTSLNSNWAKRVGEFDYDSEGRAIELFRGRYLETSDDNTTNKPLILPYMSADAVNTGEPSGLDLNRDGRTRCLATLPVDDVLTLNRERTPIG